MTPAARLGCSAAVALLVAGCGVPTESRPRSISDDLIPAELSNPPPGPPSTDRPGAVAFTVYLIGGERLRPVPRAVVGTVSPEGRLDALRAGPTAEEAASGLRSALDEATSVRVARVAGRVATIDLPSELADLVGSDQVLSLAQLVYTVTDDPAVEAVVFTVNGDPVASPVQDGTLIGRAVGRSDFPLLG